MVAPLNADLDCTGPYVASGESSDLPDVPGYGVRGEIGRGGMGRVLAAHDLILDREVALKILRPGARAERFVRESKITARLPHPGIPPVHALGTLPDGSPFLAMKLIDGSTLSEKLTNTARPQLLQAFTQVCQAVGFAHSRGVIHRDLKPSNVMVGTFGEVQVMDWGLAKDLHAVDDDEPAALLARDNADETVDHRAPEHSTDGRTRAGTVMGTPSYMAPEQARGEPTDARADVFSLGGILCTILTGEPPFSGGSSHEMIRRAAAADLANAHARLDRCGAEADLVGLCRRCLAEEPAARPANGQVVAEEMTTYLNGVQERLQAVIRDQAVAAAQAVEKRRRRRILAIAAALIILALTAGLFEARRQKDHATQAWGHAEVEQQRAEKNFATAKSLVLSMGKQINQIETGQKNTKLADLARKQALDEARQQFEMYRADRPDDESVQLQAAALHRYAGNVSRTLSDHAEAKTAYEASVQILEDLTNRFPDEVNHRYTLAQTLGDRALLEMLMGQLKDSAATLDRACTITGRPAGFDPNYDRTLGWLEHDRAKIAYLLGHFNDSLRSANHARELLDELKNAPFNEQQAIDPLLVVMAFNDVAIAQRELKKLPEAMAAHDEAAARMKALDGPQATRDITYWLCEVRHQRARTMLEITEQKTAAADDLAELTRTVEKLIDDYPQVVYYRQKLAAVLLTRGELLLKLGQPEPAAAELAKSLAVSRELLDRFGVFSASMLIRAQTYLAVGRVQAALGKSDDAKVNWRNATKVFTLALKSDPDNVHHQRGLAEAEAALK